MTSCQLVHAQRVGTSETTTTDQTTFRVSGARSPEEAQAAALAFHHPRLRSADRPHARGELSDLRGRH